MPPTILRGRSHQAPRSVLHPKEAPRPEALQFDDVEAPRDGVSFVNAIPLQIGGFESMTEFLKPTAFLDETLTIDIRSQHAVFTP
jgi:hypothetical protein